MLKTQLWNFSNMNRLQIHQKTFRSLIHQLGGGDCKSTKLAQGDVNEEIKKFLNIALT